MLFVGVTPFLTGAHLPKQNPGFAPCIDMLQNKICLLNTVFILFRPHSISSMLITDSFPYHFTRRATDTDLETKRATIPNLQPKSHSG